MTKKLDKKRSEKEALKYDICTNARRMGIRAHRSGKPDVNPFGDSDMMEKCAWSGGYFDSMRGMV